ncbi:Glucans biosynthesis glucosyltransferase H [Stieleria maiorica]|uniref:Glucans biosynthesis glucosyltransferase H n=1 Tax=Stieleria maiorica TaxID=2795974 RepID=A0A5B9M6M9_9BACT|nr:glucans biosynthesis glucosyltransferase MdoH [Stieleria maiorica]QEF96439.1 Glucans biosynthesis glucosyltransferase H [Stieleria maiorica]
MDRTRLFRAVVIMVTLVATVIATSHYYVVIAGGPGVQIAEMLTVPLFALLFAWITFSFCLATVGAASLALARNRGGEAIHQREAMTTARTAVLVPVYNESPERVFAGIQAMIQDLADHGAASTFDFYVLSDTTDPETWLQEEVAWARLSEELGETSKVFYRRRPRNVARKAGNIADFCERWGQEYLFMIVLDADSLMSASTMIEMVRRISQDSKIGILQVPPTPVGRNSLFARLQQFAAQAYGPIYVQGFSLWAGDEGNYWGHNAIIRVQAFLDHCDLPVLPGKAPLGGEILSHDFVEAALMLRAGFKVQLATDLGGSYEECPTTLADYAIRDQRWCQGNLQHTKLVAAENFRALSRFHFANGVLAFATAPLWIAFTVLCVVGAAVERHSASDATTASNSAGETALLLFAVSMALLLLPKLWSVLLVIRHPSRAPDGRIAHALSALIETVASVLLSPIMACFHSWFILAALAGVNVRWSTQQRNEHVLTWREAARQFAGFTLLGITCLALIAWAMPSLLPWFLPMISGLLLSIPIAKLASSVTLGQSLRACGLLLIAEEQSPPQVIRYHEGALRCSESFRYPIDRRPLFEQFLLDPALNVLHGRIQDASSAIIAMNPADACTARSLLMSHGAHAIPPSLHRAILQDSRFFQQLHLEAWVR